VQIVAGAQFQNHAFQRHGEAPSDVETHDRRGVGDDR
jgi:hypothetical protein